MIINPSPFYTKPGWQTAVWKKVDYEIDRPYFNMHCICQKKPIAKFVDTGSPSIDDLPKIIEIRGEALDSTKRKSKPVIIWSGQCSECKVIYWTCNSFDWVEWLTDYETIHMFVEAMPVRNMRTQSREVIRIIQTEIFFNTDGSILRVQ